MNEYEMNHHDFENEGNSTMFSNDKIQRCNGNNPTEFVQTLSEAVIQNRDILNKTLDLASQITDVYAESQRLNAQIEITREMSKVEMARITAKFLNTKQIIEETFKERRFALNASYEVLQKGMAENNSDLILAAMREIGNVVVTSPLQDIKEFARIFDDKSQTLLDF